MKHSQGTIEHSTKKYLIISSFILQILWNIEWISKQLVKSQLIIAFCYLNMCWMYTTRLRSEKMTFVQLPFINWVPQQKASFRVQMGSSYLLLAVRLKVLSLVILKMITAWNLFEISVQKFNRDVWDAKIVEKLSVFCSYTNFVLPNARILIYDSVIL